MQLICDFVFAYAKSRFSDYAAHSLSIWVTKLRPSLNRVSLPVWEISNSVTFQKFQKIYEMPVKVT